MNKLNVQSLLTLTSHLTHDEEVDYHLALLPQLSKYVWLIHAPSLRIAPYICFAKDKGEALVKFSKQSYVIRRYIKFADKHQICIYCNTSYMGDFCDDENHNKNCINSNDDIIVTGIDELVDVKHMDINYISEESDNDDDFLSHNDHISNGFTPSDEKSLDQILKDMLLEKYQKYQTSY